MRHRPRCTKIYSVRKVTNARARNFYVYENFCDYSMVLAVQPGVARAFALRSFLLLRSCGSAQFCHFAPEAPLNFVALLLWLRSAFSLPDRSLNPQITPLRNFILLWTSVGFKKDRFRMVRHMRSWLLPLLEAACPSISPDLLLAVRRRASSRLRAVCATLSITTRDRRLRFAGGRENLPFFEFA